jgi:hypothetical protein
MRKLDHGADGYGTKRGAGGAPAFQTVISETSLAGYSISNYRISGRTYASPKHDRKTGCGPQEIGSLQFPMEEL